MVRPAAPAARIAGQSGSRPDVVPVIEIIVRISWEIEPDHHAVQEERPGSVGLEVRGDGRSLRMIDEHRIPDGPELAPGSMSTFLFENSVANTRVGSQPPDANTKTNFKSFALTDARASDGYGAARAAAPAALDWRNVLRFIVSLPSRLGPET